MKNLSDTIHGRRTLDVALASNYLDNPDDTAYHFDKMADACRRAALNNGNRPTVDRLNKLATEFSLLANVIRS